MADTQYEQFEITWHDSGREPQVKPNPAYPKGIDLDASMSGRPFCMTALPYPAARCGHYLVVCRSCGTRVACTTAGRPDDPRSIRFPCRMAGPA